LLRGRGGVEAEEVEGFGEVVACEEKVGGFERRRRGFEVGCAEGDEFGF
jgi:hypothetical protein